MVRPAAWALVLAALAVAGAVLYLKSDAASERIRALAVARLSEALGRQVEIASVRLGFFPLSVEVEGLVIPGPEAGDRPVASLPRGRLEVSLSDIAPGRRPVLHLDRLWLAEPEVYIRLDPDGGTNLPRPPRRPGGGGRLEVAIGWLSVEGGAVEIAERRTPVDLEARGVEAVLEGVGREIALAGRVAAREVAVTLPRARPYPLGVAARVRIARGRVEVEQADLRGPDLQASARAVYTWGEEEPRLHVEAEGEGRGEVLTHLGYTRGEVTGPVVLRATFDWNGEVWSLAGEAGSARLDLDGRVLAGVEAELSGDPEQLRVDLRRASYAGGTLAGPVRVALGGSPAPVAVDLTVDDLAVTRLAADQGLEIAGLAGRVGGAVTYRFTADAPRAGYGWAALTVTGAGVAASGRLPLTGRVDVSIGRGVVTSQAIRLGAPSQRLLIEGLRIDLADGTGSLSYLLDTADAGRLAVLLPPPAPGEEAPAWLPSAGFGTIEGTLRFGGAQGFVAEAHLDLTAVESTGGIADHLGGSLTADPGAIDPLRLELTRNGGALLVHGRVPLEAGAGGAGGALELTVDAAGWPLEEARAFLPVELPVAGPVSGTLELGGPPEAPTGRVSATLRPATVVGMEIDEAHTDLGFGPEAVTVDELRFRVPAGEVVARGRVDLGEEGALSVDLEAAALALDAEPLAGLVGGQLAGTLELAGELAGTLERPRGRLQLAGRGLTLGRRSLGDAALTAAWDGSRLDVSGSLLGLVSLSGGGRLTAEESDLRIDLASDDLRGLVRVASRGPVPDLGGRLAGTLEVTGTPAAPTALLRLREVEVTYAGRSLAGLEPVVVRLDGSRLVIESLWLGGAGSEGGGAGGELFVGGEIELAGDLPLDLRLQASAPARWAELLLPDLRLEGDLNALGRVGGTVAEPELDGQADLSNGELILPGFPHSLEELRAVALLYPEQVVLDSLSGRLAGGRVRAAGRIALGAAEEGARATPGYRLQLSAEEVRLRYPEGWVIEGDAELVLVPAEDERLLQGSVELSRAYYLQDIELGLFQLLTRFLRRQRLEVGVADPQLAATQLNIAVNAPGAVRVRNNVADLRGSADLVVRGNLARPLVVGQVEMERGGTLVYGEAEYTVQRGLLTFASLDKIDPILDLAATTEVRSYDVTLDLSGTLERLNASFSSDPPLPDLDVLALLTTGQRLGGGGELGGVSRGGAGAGAEAFLYGQAASAVTSRVKTLFGFDRFRIDPLASAGGSVSAARLIVGKQVSRDLYVTYERDPSAGEGDLVEARWQVQPGLLLVLTVTEGDQYTLDLEWERRF